MNREKHLSEERMNAFIDGELDPEETSRVYNESARSPEIDHQLCQLRKMKELVRYAYDEVPPVHRPGGPPLRRTGPFGRALVAGVLLATGVAVGYLAHAPGSPADGPAAMTQLTEQPENYLLHVTTGDLEQMKAVLAHARYLLESVDDGETRQVEIVANERGLDLLRRDVTPYADDIRALQENNVVFYACARSIQRLEEEGVKVVLLPDTRQDYTALDRVVMRMQDGWKYEKI